MQSEIVHAPLPGVEHFRYSGDWFRIQLTFTHDPQSAGSFGDQDPAVRKESKSIRVAEAQQGDDPEFWPGDLGAAGSASAAVKNQRACLGAGARRQSLAAQSVRRSFEGFQSPKSPQLGIVTRFGR